MGRFPSLARVGGRLIASVEPTGGSGLGSRRLVALDWRSGAVLALGESHLTDTDAREFAGPVEHVVRAGRSLWALEVHHNSYDSTLPRSPRRPLPFASRTAGCTGWLPARGTSG